MYSYDQLVKMAINAMQAGYSLAEAAEMFEVNPREIEEALNG